MSNSSKDKPGTEKKKTSARGLGRGLSALMSDVGPLSEEQNVTESKAKPKERGAVETPDLNSRRVQFLSIDRLERNPEQPRRYFDKEKLSELTDSIKAKGVLQPILVRPLSNKEDTRFQIVAGERRWQAATAAGLTAMPVLIRDLNDEEVLQIGVIENVQRADLNPIEEAQAYESLINDFYRKQEEVAEAVGKSRSHIANMLRLLKLPKLAQEMLAKREISAGHARAIISAPDPLALAEEIADKKLSVREAEDWVRRIKKSDGKVTKARHYKDADTQALEQKMTDALGLQVDLNHKGPGGSLKITYKSGDQLEEIIRRLKS